MKDRYKVASMAVLVLIGMFVLFSAFSLTVTEGQDLRYLDMGNVDNIIPFAEIKDTNSETVFMKEILDKIKEQNKIDKENRRKEVVELSSELLMRHEGFRSKAYYCSQGQRTIGYGFASKTSKYMTKERAKDLLKSKVKKEMNLLDEYIPWWEDLSVERRAALVNMSFNMGIDKLMGFKNMLEHLENEEYELAGEETLKGSASGGKSRYYTQVGKRAVEVADAIKYSEWSTVA